MKSVRVGIPRGQPRFLVPAHVSAAGRPREGPGHVSRRCLAGVLLACAGQTTTGFELSLAREGGASQEANSPSRDTPKEAESPPTYIETEGRVVAVGDLHGDLIKTLNALSLAGVLKQDDDGAPLWCGGDTIVVQLGDVLDRGDCEIGILMLLRDLNKQAQAEGGAVYMVNGNHESLNVCGNFRYVTRGGFYESALAAGSERAEAATWENQLFSRVALFSPGGMIAQELAKNPTVLIVNDTVFAHGGLLPTHVDYGIEKINTEMAAWMRGDINEDGSKAAPPYIAMGGPNSILWNRTLAQEKFRTPYDKYYACTLLKSALHKVGGKRLVVGHTPQITGCNCECGGQIWRTDVGMSQGVLNALPQVLDIARDENGSTEVKVLRESMLQGDPRNLQNVVSNRASKNGRTFSINLAPQQVVSNHRPYNSP